MYTELYLYLIIACKIITANNWTINNEGECFYTVISRTTFTITTNEISPCDNIDPYITFIIANTSSINVTNNFFNTNFNSWIRIFKATNNTWPTIFSFAFSNLKNVLSIDLSGNSIKNINTPFKGIEALDSLNLSRNSIEVINADTFTTSENETRLHLLDLSYNKLSHLHKNVFERLYNLRMLYLQGNTISMLGDDVFVHLKKLVYLNLCCNNLTELNMVANQLTSLSDLDVSYNNIVTVNNNVFAGLRLLRTVDLSHNKIKALPSHLLESGLLSVNFKFNNIDNISNYVND